MDRMSIAIRPDVGASARIVQYNRLRYANILINRPVLILVERGTKILRSGEEEWVVPAGGCIALAQGETFDVVNAAEGGHAYEARWIAFEPDTVIAFAAKAGKGRPFPRAFPIHGPHKRFHDAFADCAQAIHRAGRHPGRDCPTPSRRTPALARSGRWAFRSAQTARLQRPRTRPHLE
jgi:hypothetical protein